MTGPTKHSDFLHQGRRDRLQRELEHDPYHSKSKLHEPTRCPECGAVYHKGHWSWGEAPADAQAALCPACHRISEKVPAGFLTVSGDFLAKHKEEIMHLIHNTEAHEKAEHPLKRIMAIEPQDEGLLITFTDPHLARGVGEALHHAYQGELDFKYSEEEYMLRVTWKR